MNKFIGAGLSHVSHNSIFKDRFALQATLQGKSRPPILCRGRTAKELLLSRRRAHYMDATRNRQHPK
ncbi:MAG: hypothetical protein WC429_14345, partial [Verrucomicrobiia bacterium]